MYNNYCVKDACMPTGGDPVRGFYVKLRPAKQLKPDMRMTDKNRLKCSENLQQVKNSPLNEAKVMTILYISQLKERPTQPCFSVSKGVFEKHVCVFVCERISLRVEGGRKRKEMEADAVSRLLFRLRFFFLLPGIPQTALTARPPQTRRSVCASCSQSQSRSQSCACRCPWCRCKWSRSESWHRRTSRRRPGRKQWESTTIYLSFYLWFSKMVVIFIFFFTHFWQHFF